jgi:hypothetical protein
MDGNLATGKSELERSDFSSNRHPALALCWSMIFFRRPVPASRDHALAGADGERILPAGAQDRRWRA